MKKLFALLLSFGILLGLCACGSGIDSVTLSVDHCEIVQDETLQLSYSVLPEGANTGKLIWASADEEIATVDSQGTITAVSVGQTSITVSDGKTLFAACSVTVLEKPAYDQLNEEEKAFVDCIVAHLDDFVKPDSIEVTGIQFIPGEDIEDFWNVEIKGETALGTSTSDLYFLNRTYGFSESPYSIFISSDPTYRLALVNRAIDERR